MAKGPKVEKRRQGPAQPPAAAEPPSAPLPASLSQPLKRLSPERHLELMNEALKQAEMGRRWLESRRKARGESGEGA
ncbi:hypothetical protein [Azospirillum sp. ST 5-10]|uniref:hypothetical protein n=1 Tax=unclassified Azospirillum TaxID=2630922 RepID=UPI003F4A451F